MSLKSVGIVLVFLAFPVFALAASTLYGKVVGVAPCPASTGVLFFVGSPPVSAVFRPGVTAAIPPGVSPRVGQTVFVGLGSMTPCGAASAPLATYFSSSTPARPPASSSNAGGSALSAQVQSLIQQLLGKNKPASSASGGNSRAAGSSGNSGGSGSLQYGGSITTPPIDCTCTNNYLIVVNGHAGPKSFLYTKGAPQYAEHALPSPNIWTLFNYTPGGQCLVSSKCVPPPGVPLPEGTLTPNVGTSRTL